MGQCRNRLVWRFGEFNNEHRQASLPRKPAFGELYDKLSSAAAPISANPTACFLARISDRLGYYVRARK